MAAVRSACLDSCAINMEMQSLEMKMSFKNAKRTWSVLLIKEVHTVQNCELNI